MRSRTYSLLIMACALAALALCRADAATTTANTATDESTQYFVMIDAGSTGSRAHVHTYVLDPTKKLPVVEESVNEKIRPGLSDAASNPASASESISKLLTFIRKTVPKAQWTTTPIHVHATAGLRSVTPAEANAILEVVRDDLSASGFLFERHWARIISGEQEGINGWMAVNYLLGTFDKSAEKDGSPPTSTGVVEMGGSSMQITFAPSSPSDDDRRQLDVIDIAGHKYYLYTHSFLQYGLQAAEKLYQRLAISDIEENGNPCYPRSFRHSSTGNFEQCTDLLNRVVDKSIKCSTNSCSFNGVYQPQIEDEQFLAIENFYYTAKFFGTEAQQDSKLGDKNSAAGAPVGNQVTAGLRAKGAEFCNKAWPSLVEDYKPLKTPLNELSTFCFSAAYQSVVLESGLGFHPGANLKVAKTIQGKSIDWEMGATIFELLKAQVASESLKDEEEVTSLRPIDLDPTIALPVSNHVSEESLTHSGFCKTCALYTVLFGMSVVLSYLGYLRYSKRMSVPMTSYSQSAFGRV